MEDTTRTAPSTSIFSPTLKEKIRDAVGEEGVEEVELIIVKHIVLSAKDFGTRIGKAIAQRIFNYFGEKNVG